jgi:hypothetical protein
MFGADAVRCMRRSSGGGGGDSDPYWDNVVSLLKFEGVDQSKDFIDAKGVVWNAIDNIKIDWSEYKFGFSSCLSDGSNDRLEKTALQHNYGTDDFTIEAWVRPIGTNGMFFSIGQSSSEILVGMYSGKIYCRSNGSSGTFSGTQTISLNEWHHVALVRENNGTSLKVYLDGALEASTTYTPVSFSNTQHKICSSQAFVLSLNGWIDEYRVTGGVARYTANFTPPTEPFPEG